MKNFLLKLLITLTTIFGCRTLKDRNTLQDFNAKSTVLAIQIEGQVAVPPADSEKIREIQIWNNVERYIRHNPHLPEATLLSYIEAAKSGSQIDESYNHHLDLSVEGTIKEQLKYAIRINGTKIPISVAPGSIHYQINDGIVHYSAKVLMNPTEPNLRSSVESTRFFFPKRPFEVAFRVNDWKDAKDILKTREIDQNNVCHKADGDPVAPHSYFYYLNPYENSECLQKFGEEFVEVKKISLESQEPRKVWPEYDLMFSDNKLEVVVAFDPGWISTGPPQGLVNYESFKEHLVRDQYILTSTISEKDVVFSKSTQNGLTIVVRTFLVSDPSHVSERLSIFDGYSNEIILYSGHSDYGKALSDAFNSKEFPISRYQIFGLFSCNSYEYGKANILASKAIVDFDPTNLYADLIVTAHSIRFGTMVPAISELIKFFEDSFFHYSRKSLLEQFDYLSLLNRLDARDVRGENAAIFTIAGEEGNRFNPVQNGNIQVESRVPYAGSLQSLLKELIVNHDATEATKTGFVKKAILRRGHEAFEPLFQILRTPNQEIHNSVIRGIYEAEAIYPESYNSQLVAIVEKEPSTLDFKQHFALLNRFYVYKPQIEELFLNSIQGSLGAARQEASIWGIYEAEKTTPRIFSAMINNLEPNAPDQLFSAIQYTYDNHPDLEDKLLTKIATYSPKNYPDFYGRALEFILAIQKKKNSKHINNLLLEYFMVENTNLSVARQIAEYFDRIELSSEHTQRVAHNLQTLIVRAQTESWPLSTFLCLLAKITPNRASQLKPYILTAEALASDDIERRLVMQTIERLANPDEELRNIAKKLKKDMQR